MFRRGGRNQLLRLRQQLLQLGRAACPGRLFGLKVLQLDVQVGQPGLGGVGPLGRERFRRFVLPAEGRVRAGTVGGGSNLHGGRVFFWIVGRFFLGGVSGRFGGNTEWVLVRFWS